MSFEIIYTDLFVLGEASDPEDELLTFSEAIATQKDRMWGNPTVAGTRVPIFRLAELARAGYSAEEIGIGIYPHLGVERAAAALRAVGFGVVDTRTVSTSMQVNAA